MLSVAPGEHIIGLLQLGFKYFFKQVLNFDFLKREKQALTFTEQYVREYVLR